MGDGKEGSASEASAVPGTARKSEPPDPDLESERRREARREAKAQLAWEKQQWLDAEGDNFHAQYD